MWVRLDDKFHRNQKVAGLSDNAFRLFVLLLSYSGDTTELTGYVTKTEAESFARGHGKKLFVIDELVHLGFLEPVNGGYLIHDFPEYIPRTSRERTRAWRERKRSERHGDVTVTSQAVTPLARARRVPEPEPVPEPVVINYPSVGSPNSHPTLNMTRLGEHLPKIQRGGQ